MHNSNKITLTLAGIYSIRMLGLFMILPILGLYTSQLQHATPFLIGVALGIYGLTQALLQIPFGILSDKLGRKPIICFGLVLFMLGSLIAALSHSITGIIIGRSLQGAGAIGSTLIALLADSVSESYRLRAMSIIGMSIGLTFVIAMILGPLLNPWIGLSGIFWLTTGLTVAAILLLFWQIPAPTHTTNMLNRSGSALHLLRSPTLLSLDFGIFCLHAILTMLFLTIPLDLQQHLAYPGLFYLIILGVACVGMVPFMIIAEKKKQIRRTYQGAILTLILTTGLLSIWHRNLWVMGILLCIFFTAFTLLEGILPSWIAKTAPITQRGAAMGIYSTAQFLGIFCGGIFGGWLSSQTTPNALFIACAILALLWLLLTYRGTTHDHA